MVIAIIILTYWISSNHAKDYNTAVYGWDEYGIDCKSGHMNIFTSLKHLYAFEVQYFFRASFLHYITYTGSMHVGKRSSDFYLSANIIKQYLYNYDQNICIIMIHCFTLSCYLHSLLICVLLKKEIKLNWIEIKFNWIEKTMPVIFWTHVYWLKLQIATEGNGSSSACSMTISTLFG